MADLVLSAGVIIIIFLVLSSTHDAIGFSKAKTDSNVLSINNAYGFSYKASGDNNNNNNNRNLTIEKFQQIKDIQDAGLPFPEYIHKISISAANPQNTTAIKDYKAIQKHMEQIDKSIDGCDIKKDFITSSIDATKLLQGLHMVDRNNRTNESHRLHVLLLSTTSRAGAKLIVALIINYYIPYQFYDTFDV
jgi:hypothetical protein